MKKIILNFFSAFYLFTGISGYAQTIPPLGEAANFSILAGSSIANSGTTTVKGDVGVSPGSQIAGLGSINGTTHSADTKAKSAQSDLTVAYNNAMNQAATKDLSGKDLGGQMLLPGVYKFNGDANLNGNLELNANGNPNSVFIIQVNGNLNIADNSTINLSEGASGKDIFWIVKNNAIIGSGVNFYGTIIANQAITSGANTKVLFGRFLSRSGAVAINSNNITVPLKTFVADLEIEKYLVQQPPYRVGDTILYKVIARNFGPDQEVMVYAQDILPVGLRHLNSTSLYGKYNPATGTYTIENFPAGATDTLTISARIDSAGYITNISYIAGDGIDYNEKNDESCASLCAVPATPGLIYRKNPCTGSEGLYTVDPVPGATKYVWTVPADWQIKDGQNTNTIRIVPNPNANMTGVITVSTGNICEQLSLPSKLTVNLGQIKPIDAPPISGDTLPCIGQTGLKYSVSPIEGVTYLWSAPVNATITAGQNTSEITVTAGKVNGWVILKVNNGCGPGLESHLAIKSNTSAAAAMPGPISGDTVSCKGTSKIYSISPVTGASSYKWYLPSGWQIAPGSSDTTTSISVIVGSTSDTISVSAVNGCGPGSAQKLFVKISAQPLSIIGDSIVCQGKTDVIFRVPSISGANAVYLWTVPADWKILSGDSTNMITVMPGSSGTISVSSNNSCTSGASTSRAVMTATDVPSAPIKIDGTYNTCIGETTTKFTVTPVTNASRYTWSIPEGWEIISGQGTNTITVKIGEGQGNISVFASNGCGDGATTTITSEQAVLKEPNINIPNVFTPNGDGINDMYVIRNLEKFPDNQLTIVNRWGNEVFKQQHYMNDWDGGRLEDGTYFYVLTVKLCDADKKYTGYVKIIH